MTRRVGRQRHEDSERPDTRLEAGNRRRSRVVTGGIPGDVAPRPAHETPRVEGGRASLAPRAVHPRGSGAHITATVGGGAHGSPIPHPEEENDTASVWEHTICSAPRVGGAQDVSQEEGAAPPPSSTRGGCHTQKHAPSKKTQSHPAITSKGVDTGTQEPEKNADGGNRKEKGTPRAAQILWKTPSFPRVPT